MPLSAEPESYFHFFKNINAALCINRMNLFPHHKTLPNPYPFALCIAICEQALILGSLSCRRRLLTCSWQPAALFLTAILFSLWFSRSITALIKIIKIYQNNIMSSKKLHVQSILTFQRIPGSSVSLKASNESFLHLKVDKNRRNC